jgi:predicted aspartyl protease
MGTFDVQIQLADTCGTRFESIDAMVDTGATYTVLPASLLRSLGIEPHRTSVFELAGGRQVQVPAGRALAWLGDQEELTLVIIGEEGVAPLLGAVTLEDFLLAPDLIRRELIAISGLLRGFR